MWDGLVCVGDVDFGLGEEWGGVGVDFFCGFGFGLCVSFGFSVVVGG